jgi:hypothetical protein
VRIQRAGNINCAELTISYIWRRLFVSSLAEEEQKKRETNNCSSQSIFPDFHPFPFENLFNVVLLYLKILIGRFAS